MILPFKKFPKHFLIVLAALLLAPASGWCQAAPTVINALPYTVSVPGNYVLNIGLADNASDGYSIFVNANNVTIDFNGNYISNRAAGASTTKYGVYAAGVNNLTLKNGTISGYQYGVYTNKTGNQTLANYGTVIENMRFINQTYTAVYVANASYTFTMRNCQISGVGGSGNSNAYGIYLNGVGGSDIRGNNINGVTAAAGTAYGMYLVNGNNFVKDNVISSSTVGIYLNSGKYQDNITSNCATPYSGGTAVGTNG